MTKKAYEEIKAVYKEARVENRKRFLRKNRVRLTNYLLTALMLIITVILWVCLSDPDYRGSIVILDAAILAYINTVAAPISKERKRVKG